AGGGPAGSTFAWRLQKSGMKTAILDKAVFPRDKVCGGWITPAVLDLLDLNADAYGRNHVCQPISGFMTALLPGNAVRTDYSQPVSYGIRRVEFDEFLLKRSGAVLRLGEAVHAIRRAGKSWQVNETIETPLLIGAGGHHCPVAKFLGAQPGRGEKAVAAKETEFLLDPETASAIHVDPQIPHLYFCHDLKGYGWCFRKGNYLNIGMGRENSEGLNDHLEQWVLELKRRKIIPSGIALNFKGHSYLLRSHSVRPLAADGVLLIGDAAGLAFSKSGEGILPAVESGLMAAASVLSAGEKYDRNAFRSYEENMLIRFGPGGRDCRIPAREYPWRKFIAQGLMASRWFVRRWVLDSGFLHTGLLPLNPER
ncbi:MAG TPA: NAD(P)/FAD-dependent oxidoreductase, partial [Nitrospiria bacterium]|nr:NAD(P)/FAD-dependent oxidoreductase [Nitrospiria bacterium]